MRVGFTYNVIRDSPRRKGGDEVKEEDPLPSDFYAEWDDQSTIDAIHRALAKHHEVIPIEANWEAFDKLEQIRPDIVFNIAEGYFGTSRESQIPAMLEMLNIPYTGSDPLTLAICLDKSRAKEILAFHRIPTAKFSVIRSLPLDGRFRPLRYPLFVKPLFEGSSKGIRNTALVNCQLELIEQVKRVLTEYNQPALVEEYLPGREFTVALLGNGEQLQVLPIVEIKFDELPKGVNPFYSYEAKWIWDRPEKPLEIFQCPAPIDEELKLRLENIAKKAFTILGCRDWCRIDIRLDSAGNPKILELNPLPGVLPNPEDNSCFPKAARAAGLTYEELINKVLEIAIRRYGLEK